jgi:hypothetical protein
MTTQLERATRFKSLHEREGAFVIPNPWDIGSARRLASSRLPQLIMMLKALTSLLTRAVCSRGCGRLYARRWLEWSTKG